MTADYYAVLGVRPNANADEIKMAYRRLARELHPDVNPDPVSQERFKEVTQAHEVLSDPGKRHMYDLADSTFAAGDGYFGQARRERSRYEYPQDRWESQRERWPPRASDDAWSGPWNPSRDQSWDQTPYSSYRASQAPSFSFDWQLPPAVKPHRPRPIREAVIFVCVVLALAVVVADRVVAHHSGLRSVRVTATRTIRVLHATWAPPLAGETPTMTAEQAWTMSGQGGSIHPSVQLGVLTQHGHSECGPACDGVPVLAYGYYWTACVPPADVPATKCWNWLFLSADTGMPITGEHYQLPLDPSP